MKTYNMWTGIDKEILFIVNSILNEETEKYPELKPEELRALLCAALAGNLVGSEIRESMAWQYEQGEDGSESRNQLNKLTEKYKT